MRRHGSSDIGLPGDEFLFVQFLIAADIELGNDTDGAFLRIMIAFPI